MSTPGADLIGHSDVMQELRSRIHRVARTSLPVIVYGETGSGKELVARALHAASGRNGALVAFNVCAISEPMFEAALFGHVRGAFTGAVTDSRGFLAEANGGTLFLDEISGLSSVAQAKLLRAIETKEYRPVGAHSDRRSDFRVVAATNESLQDLVATGRFRADLLQRLSGVRLLTPPLRSRPHDVPLLVEHFCRTSAHATGDARPRFTDGAMAWLQTYAWPGNVRELRHIVECAMALATERWIGAAELEALLTPEARTGVAEIRKGQLDRELLSALEQANWDVDAVAARLGVHRATIYRRLKRAQPAARVPSLPSSLSRSEGARLQLEK